MAMECLYEKERARERERVTNYRATKNRRGERLQSVCLCLPGLRLGTMHLSGLVNERLASVVTAMPGYWNKRLKMISGNTGPPGLLKIIRTSKRKKEVERGRWKGRNGDREKDREREKKVLTNNQGVIRS